MIEHTFLGGCGLGDEGGATTIAVLGRLRLLFKGGYYLRVATI